MKMHAVAALGVSAVALAATPAFAVGEQAAAAGSGAGSTGILLEEIIVTAQKREQSLSQVPISISVLGGEALTEKSVSNLQDMAATVPNFQITKTGLTTQTFIRGIGSGNDPAFEQSVAQYVDGINYGRAALTRAPFFDTQRVEVLRGPQSILFGKNSTAGALSVIAARPTDFVQAGLTTTYTPAFDQFETTAFVSGPVADNLSARVAVRHAKGGGYVRNLTKDKDEPDGEDIAARATLHYDGNGFNSTLKVEYSKFDVTGRELEVVADNATRTIPAGPTAGQPLTFASALALQGLPGVLTDTSFDFKRQSDLYEKDSTKLYNITWTNDIEVGDAVVSAVTGLVDYQRGFHVDLDFTNANMLGGLTDESFRQISQELRLASAEDGTFSFIGGLYFEHSKIDYADATEFGRDLVRLGYGAIADVSAARTYRQSSTTYAAFGQVTARATDDLRLIGGLRLSRDEKEAARRVFAIQGQGALNGTLVTSPVTIATLQAGLGFSLDNPGGAGHDINASRGQTRLVPSVTVEYDVTDDTMLFASYKEGYKGGGFNVRANNNANFEFDDETVETWEAGIRSGFLGNRGSMSLTAYRSTYANLQISQFDGTVGFNVGNAGRTRAQGVEAEARYALAPGVTAGTSVSYLDFEYLEFRRGNCAFGQTPDGDVVGGVRLCDYTGRRGRFTPKLNLMGNLTVNQPLTDMIDLRSGLDVSYRSSHQVHDNLDPLGQVKGYTLVDMRVGIGTDTWDLAVLGKNLLDKHYLTYSANVPFASSVGANTQYASVARGRAVSLQASLKY